MQKATEPSALQVTDGVALAGLLTGAVILLARWRTVPSRMAIHFNLRGDADGFGGRGWLLFPLLFSLGMWTVFFAVRRAPRLFNLPGVPGSAERLPQERLAAQLLAVLGAVMAWLSVCLELMELGNASGTISPLTVWITPLVLFSTLTPVVWFALRLRMTRAK